MVARSHLTKSVTSEVSPTAANKKAVEETSHGDIVSSGQTQFLNGINSPFHTKDSAISVNIAHLNFRALIDTGAAVTAVSARVWQRCASNISLNLGPPNHDSITTVDGCLLKVIGRVMLPLACEASVSVLFRSKGHAKNGASKRGGGGEERKETLADKPRNFENHPHRLSCLSARTDI